MSDIEESASDKIKKIGELLKEIRSRHKISVRSIVDDYLRFDAGRYSSMNKCANGTLLPEFLIPIADEVMERLEELLEEPALIKAAIESRAAEENSKYKLEYSLLVWIPFDRTKEIIPYTMGNDPGKVIEMTEGNWGLVAFRSDSADGKLNADHLHTATVFWPGTEFVFRRVDIMKWIPDCYYLIVDSQNQLSIRQLLVGDNKEIVKYAPMSSPKGPFKELLLSDIKAMYVLELASVRFKPETDSNSQE